VGFPDPPELGRNVFTHASWSERKGQSAKSKVKMMSALASFPRLLQEPWLRRTARSAVPTA
jgi:hypothetical protein